MRANLFLRSHVLYRISYTGLCASNWSLHQEVMADEMIAHTNYWYPQVPPYIRRIRRIIRRFRCMEENGAVYHYI